MLDGGLGPVSLAPVDLPEFGQSVSWLMCRNGMCPNFGRHYGGPEPSPGDGAAHDDRYRVDLRACRLHCKFCGQSFGFKSNLCVRPLARYFLSLSLPFADCPNLGCRNHGANLFEHFDGGQRRYRRDSPSRAACRSCGTRIRLGEALHIERSRSAKRSMAGILDGVRTGDSVTEAVERLGVGVGTYHDRLERGAARLRDNLAWRNAKLLHPRFERERKPVRVQTDVLEASLQRLGEGPRHQELKWIVSVVALPDPKVRSYYILAAHPFFLPSGRCPDFDETDEDVRLPLWERRWDALEHLHQIDLGKGSASLLDNLPDVSRNGLFIRSPYAELAHFLVVDRMLRRFPRTHCVVDGDKALCAAALTAFRHSTLSGRVEVAAFQHDKEEGRSKRSAGGRLPRFDPAKRLAKAWREAEDRLAKRLNPEGGLALDADAADPRLRARAFRSAFKGAYSGTGGWAWLEHPPESMQYARPRTLWLTRRPGRGLEDGEELLLGTTLQSADSAFNSMRSRVRGLRRPDFRAAPGRGYRDRYFDVEFVCAEVWIYLLLRNFVPRRKGAGKDVPARAFGLMAPKARPVNLLETAWTFRLDTRHAERMSSWLRR